MAVNPSLRPEHLNNPTQRANEINDPQFQNQQGYFGYDLTHAEFPTPRFGEVTPTMHLDTAPADRIVCHDNLKTVLNQIDGNFLSTLNQYVDSFYVPLRSLFPINYEKLIPNPTKGDDLPNKALPQVPLFGILASYFRSWEHEQTGDGSHVPFTIYSTSGVANPVEQLIVPQFNQNPFESGTAILSDSEFAVFTFGLGRLALLAYVLSRGQLMDYLGIQLDDDYSNRVYRRSELQFVIDEFFSALADLCIDSGATIYGYPLELDVNRFDPSSNSYTYRVNGQDLTLSTWRQAISDIFERGEQLIIVFGTQEIDSSSLSRAYNNLYNMLDRFFPSTRSELGLSNLDSSSNPFSNGYYVNMSKFLAYQQCIAHYFVNNTVDNVFTSDLFMQNLRSVMYPASGNGTVAQVPVFNYNGVETEYDLISTGATEFALLAPHAGISNRQYVWMTLMLLMRRSLRYGDYFATARPNMLAVGQLSIPVNTVSSGTSTVTVVSPIDVTQNLLKQRYLNAANYIGSGVLQWYASMYGVTPSDMGSFPRFLAHRKIELQNQITNNTADNQGAQTTNLVGYSDNNAFDVFIDDFGVILSVTSYDVLPVYLSGIDSGYHLADRFDYFNPMLQNIGDQPIRLSELYGNPIAYDNVFGYTMRNSEYKFKVSRAHGAFINSLPGFLMKYPYGVTSPDSDISDYSKISPDFIRDKAYYLDSSIPSRTGASPGSYFHFVCSCVNQVHAARKIQATPPVLF